MHLAVQKLGAHPQHIVSSGCNSSCAPNGIHTYTMHLFKVSVALNSG